MNILTAKYHESDRELIEVFEAELVFLNAIIGEQSTEEQLSFVKQAMTEEGFSDLKDAVAASFIAEILTGNEEDFVNNLKLLLLELQFPLGVTPHKPRNPSTENDF